MASLVILPGDVIHSLLALLPDSRSALLRTCKALEALALSCPSAWETIDGSGVLSTSDDVDVASAYLVAKEAVDKFLEGLRELLW